jgi:hypothetical protein
VYGEASPTRPNFIELRWSLLHDTFHAVRRSRGPPAVPPGGRAFIVSLRVPPWGPWSLSPAPSAAAAALVSWTQRPRLCRRLPDRQPDLEPGVTWFGVDPDIAVVAPDHYPVTDVQAQARAVTDVLRSEEGFKNAALY